VWFVLHGMFVGANTKGHLVCRRKSVGWHLSNYVRPKWQPCIIPTTCGLCLAIPWFTHRVPTWRFTIHSNVKKKIKEIPWRVAKGAKVGCGLWAGTCDTTKKWVFKRFKLIKLVRWYFFIIGHWSFWLEGQNMFFYQSTWMTYLTNTSNQVIQP
jgi:hypothetical protein